MSAPKSKVVRHKQRAKIVRMSAVQELEHSEYRAKRTAFLSSDEARRLEPVPVNATGGSRR
jgi:hypothetical protein